MALAGGGTNGVLAPHPQDRNLHLLMKRDILSTLPTVLGTAALLAAPSFAQSIRTVAPKGVQAPAQDLVSVPVITVSGFVTPEAPMLRGDTAATSAGWNVQPLTTVSERVFGYQAPGIMDGVGAFKRSGKKVDVFVNHELNPGNGYPYALANGTVLTGARITKFRLERDVSSGTPTTIFKQAKLAIRRIYDRNYTIVTDPAQINETGNNIDGLARLCSANGVSAGTYGFVDDIFFTGEETGKPFHPHGGTEFALDVSTRTLWAVPAMGRMAWENVTPLDTGNPHTVGILCGDDSQAAPLYLYIGEKNAIGDGSFLDRNGLVVGKLYAWKADNGDLTPEHFNGDCEMRSGTWVEVTVQDPQMAGMAGYDDFGYADIDTLQNEADALGCFSFSRPEDLATNPLDATQAVFASTGRGALYPSDNWGIIYVVDVDFQNMAADLIIVHDADDLAIPDEGIRSPDNLDWGRDGKLYIQEDRSTSPSSLFGQVTGIEASVWQLDPITHSITRIAEIDRSVVVPAGSTDIGAGQIGHWESSGILDVTHLFDTMPGERLLIATVQAHGIRDGKIGDNPILDEGGQLLFLSKPAQ